VEFDDEEEEFELYTIESRSYCCLGVLCNLQGLKEEVTSSNYIRFRLGESAESDMLPLTLIEKLGMHDSKGGLYGLANTLARLNDSGSSFKEIAQVIRGNWQRLLREYKELYTEELES